MITLHVDIDTDDDCEISYENAYYGVYGNDLVFAKEFETRKEAIDHLREIRVLAGWKITDWLYDFMQEAMSLLKDQDQVTCSGNQTICIRLAGVATPEEELHERYERELKALQKQYGIDGSVTEMVIADQYIPADGPETPPRKVYVMDQGGIVSLAVEGLGTACDADTGKAGSGVVSLEIWEGEPRLLIWNDINREDPTVIGLAGAIHKENE